MKNIQTKLLLALLFTGLYNLFFWQESLGLNLFLFSTLLTGTLIYLNQDCWKTYTVKITVLSTMMTALMVVWHNSSSAKLAHSFSLIIMIGFIHQTALQSVYLAAASYVGALIKVPDVLQKAFQALPEINIRVRLVYKKLQLTLLPLVILMVFYWIYYVANPVFEQLSDTFWSKAGNILTVLFQGISFSRLIFILFAFILMIAAFNNSQAELLVKLESSHDNQLIRKKSKHSPPAHHFNPAGLKHEYFAAILLIIASNLLLLIINIIDINWIWFGFDSSDIPSLSQFVHEGTYMLILSILLSMVILLYYFRGNLNFYQQNKWLKTAAYWWIFQNGILLISVALRNYHYIHAYGLAYKRIGVVLFLLLTLFGLYTFYIKIKKKKSAWYLYRVNSWAVFLLLMINSLFNWDILITNYNLTRTGANVDKRFLLSLSDKTLPILTQHKALFSNVPERSTFYQDHHEPLSETDYLHLRVAEFQSRWESKSWLSWNWAEYKAYQRLKNKQ